MEHSMEININSVTTVLEALSLGIAVDVGDTYPLAMGEDGSIGWLYEGRVVSEMNTGTFVRLCSSLDKDEVLLVAANIVLNNLNKKAREYNERS